MGRAVAEDLRRLLRAWAPHDAGQATLRAEYLAFLDGAGHAATARDLGRAHVTASAFVLSPDLASVLLCFHRKGGFWVQLGGHVEPGDASVAEAAAREAREECGIAGLRPIGPVPADLDRHDLGAGFARCDTHWDVGVLLVAPAGAVPIASVESVDVAWWPVDALPAPVPPGFADRVARAAAIARQDGTGRRRPEASMGTDLPHARFEAAHVLMVGTGEIGRATAERLAREGAHLTIADLDEGAAHALVARLGGDRHRALPIDVRDAASVDDALAAATEGGRAIDAVAHVAGGDLPHGSFEQTGDDVWRAALELNLLGPVRVARAALPALRTSGRGPAIAIVGSVNGLVPIGSEPYSAAKAALGSVVQNLAADLGPAGVRVNAVAPGTIRTRVWDAQGGPDRLAPLYPLGRVGEPEDVAGAIAFLCSPDAAWITGHVLPVDGGLLARKVSLA